MQHLLLLITTMSACASAMHIEKRANTLLCETPASCVSYYKTGSAQCSNGYTRFNLEAYNFATGSYCEKACDNSERIECGAAQCTFNKGQCDRYPNDGICADAINWCSTSIETTKENCAQINKSQPVKYDEAAGTCAADPDAPKDNHFLQFAIGKLSLDRIFLSCAPVTAAGAESIIIVMIGVALCGPSTLSSSLSVIPTNTAPYKIAWSCLDDTDKYSYLTEVFQKACAAAAHPGDAAPTFEKHTN
jgi:hypothetical protein